MTTPEEIALFIQNSAIKEPLPNRFRVESIKLDIGYAINWWRNNGHFNEALYLQIAKIKSK